MNHRRRFPLASVTPLLAALPLACAPSPPPPAEAPPPRAPVAPSPAATVDTLAIVNGAIYTLDPGAPRAEVAVAEKGKFTCVGTRAACPVPAGARILDLNGGSAIPGLADAHGHVLGYGQALRAVDLGGAASEAECIERIAARAKTLPKGQWVYARGWDQTKWAPARFPTEAALSRAVPQNPVFAERVDGHAAWVNAAALETAAVTAQTRDPAGGAIVRDAAGRPTGVLVDNAQRLVAAKIPPMDDGAIREALLAAMHRLVAVGLTSVHDPGVDARTLAVYRALAESDQLPLRVYAMLDGQRPLPALRAEMNAWKGTPTIGRLTVRAVKLYADGALGSRGAWMSEPYADDPKNEGLTVTDPEDLRAKILEVARSGFQPAVHAIGDRACATTIDDFAAASKLAPDLRPRVEHLQILLAKDVPRLRDAGAIASMQPTHATSDAPWAEQRLGHGTARQKGAYAWRQVLDAHVPLACGSDFPVEDIDPRKGLFSAETRRYPGGPADGWMPEQRMTRDEAVRCFTSGAAYAEHAEDRRGAIRVGFDADLTAFEKDVFAVPADALPSLPVTATVVGGRAPR